MKKLLLVIFFTMLPVLAYGATYYVATTGSDNNSCSSAKSQSTPKQTINAGAGCLGTGDTLIVKGGTYAECLSDVIPNGTAGAPITVQSETLRSAIIQPSTTCTNTTAVWFNNRSYIVFDGFVVDLSANVSPINDGGIWRGGTTNHVTIQNTEIRNMRVPANLGNGGCGICSSTDENNNLTRQNYIHHLASANTDASANVHAIYITGNTNVYEHNECAFNASHGIHMYNAHAGSSAYNNIVRNNVVHDNGSRGMLIGSGDNNAAYNNIVYHNGLGDNTEAINVNGYGNFATNSKIYNNTIYGNKGMAIFVRGGDAAMIRNNILWQNGSDTVNDSGSGTVIDHNLTGANPLFVNATAQDFHLSAGSPAIDAGVVMSGLSYNGSAPDLGALESGTIGTLPTPVNLRLIGN